jgi:microcystin-dependent protein
MDAILGSLLLVPFSWAPQGWLPCNGMTMQVNQNAALFSLLGTQFGGDGHSTFALPKLEAPAPNLHWIICTEGLYPVRP